MASISITTEDDDATPSSSSLSPGGLQAHQQPQATISLSSIATLNLPTANTARLHLGAKKKSESIHLHPGYSMLDWTRYTQSAGDLTGVGGQLLRVSSEELAKHNTEGDAWTVVRGVVYNITPFMKYHPGGKAQLMRGAGNDCTELFDKIHIWVNSESILQKCIVGVYTGAPAVSSGSSLAVKQANKVTSGSTKEEEESVGVITLEVPKIKSPDEHSDYLVTTYNSVTGYETSV